MAGAYPKNGPSKVFRYLLLLFYSGNLCEFMVDFVYVVGLRLICSVDLEMISHYMLPLVSMKTISHETPYRIWFGVLRKIMVTCPWHVVRDSKS